MSVKPYVVGIAGGSASGKTSFLKKLLKKLPENSCCVVSQDNYYMPQSKQTKDEFGHVNYDLPTSIDRELFFNDMKALMNGEPIQKLEYTFNNADKKPEVITIQPAPILIMEGLFIFHYSEIRDLLDLKIFIDAREEVKLKRRLKRDFEERGYAEDVVLHQWNHHVMPSFKTYLMPYRDEADIIVTNNISYTTGLEVVSNHLNTFTQTP